MQYEGNCVAMSLNQVDHANHKVAALYQLYPGAINMKFSLSALNTACAVASSAFAGFDYPPVVPPHAPAVSAA
jgi:hypothetical protein